MTKNLTCIACPLGCQITVTLQDGIVEKITGNTCPRGAKYAEDECTHPVRTVTTTMACDDGTVVSVKTKEPIGKEYIFEAMEIINQKTAHLPISVGDTLIDDFFGTCVVATQEKK